jgi:hypothetical protein
MDLFKMFIHEDSINFPETQVVFSEIEETKSGFKRNGKHQNNCHHVKVTCDALFELDNMWAKRCRSYTYGPFKDSETGTIAYHEVIMHNSAEITQVFTWYSREVALACDYYTLRYTLIHYSFEDGNWRQYTLPSTRYPYSFDVDTRRVKYRDKEYNIASTTAMSNLIEALGVKSVLNDSDDSPRRLNLRRDREFLDDLIWLYDPSRDIDSFSSCVRAALLKFKLHSSTFFTDLVDTFSSPSAPLELLQDYCSVFKAPLSLFTRRGSGKFTKLSLKDINAWRNNVKNVYLGTLYGVKAPLGSLTPDNLWWSAIKTYLPNSTSRDKYTQAMSKALRDIRLRSRESVGEGYDSVNIYLVKPEDLTASYYHSLYRSGILPTFEGAWDLCPLSFVVDWVTALPSLMSQACDALSIKAMIEIDHYCYTRKRVDYFSENWYLSGQTLKVEYRVTYYGRYFTDSEPSSLLHFHEALQGGSFSVKKLPQAIALLS